LLKKEQNKIAILVVIAKINVLNIAHVRHMDYVAKKAAIKII